MAATKASFVLAVHGGAGTIPRYGPAASRAASYHEGLQRALAAGREVLASGGDALDGVTSAVVALEDDPRFNAGRGSDFSAAGTHEMDACVKEGVTHRAGAVAGILGPRNPVLAARAVMECSRHVLMIGEGALAFCREAGVAFCEPNYFYTEQRWCELQQALEHRDDEAGGGTVGAVACDRHGNLAAATSTGGRTGKAPGRMRTTRPAPYRRPAMGNFSSAMASGSRSPPACATPAKHSTAPRRQSSVSLARSGARAASSRSIAPVC